METYSEHSHAASAAVKMAEGGAATKGDVRLFLQAVALPLQFVAILPDKGKLRVYRATNAEELKAALLEVKSLNNGGWNIYYEGNIGGKLNQKGEPARNTEASITHIRCIAGDKDAKDGVTMEQCEAAVNALPLRPSFIVKSGGGLQPVYLLEEIVEATDGNRAKARAAGLGLAALLGGDPTFSLEHLFRVPGFMNLPDKKKREAGREKVKVTIGEATEITYSLDDLFEAFGKHCPASPAAPKDVLGNINGKMPGAFAGFAETGNTDLKQEYPPSDAHRIADECKVVGEMRDKHGNVEEPLWRAVLGVLAYTAQGDAVCHAYSSGYDGYTKAETQSKIDRFRANATGATLCETLSHHRPEACKACPHWDPNKSPIRLGVDRSTPAAVSAAQVDGGGAQADTDGWAKPTPISSAMHPVPAWEPQFLPDPVAEMVVDFADNVPMNREFVASNIAAAAGSILSGKVLLSLKDDDTWIETPNSWALNIAPPSSMKTPGLQECNYVLNRINDAYAQNYRTELAAHKGQVIAYEAAKKALSAAAKSAAMPGQLPPEPEPPVQHRAVTHDSTPEKMGDLARGGPVALVLDEAAGLLGLMADPKNLSGRAFYNAAYNGNQPYKVDRIMRGSLDISRLCVSIIGNIQPERLLSLLLSAARDGVQDDGFMQRFGLMTYPDPVPHTELVESTRDLFKYLPGRDALIALKDYDPVMHGAEQGAMLGNDLPYFRLSDDALGLWRTEYRRRRTVVEDIDLMLSYRNHVIKHPKVIATVALVIHAVEGHKGDISGAVMERAIAASNFYLSHAKRVYYMAAHDIYTEPAQAIARRMSRGEITDAFTSRDAYTNGWSGCYDADRADAILSVLEDTNWIRSVAAGTTSTKGGRPSKRWLVNPLAKGAKW